MSNERIKLTPPEERGVDYILAAIKSYADTRDESTLERIKTMLESDAVKARTAAIPDELRKIGELIRTQDNRITDQPMFIVQQKRTYVGDENYNNCRVEWRETKSGDYVEASITRAKRLDKVFEATFKYPAGWERFAVHDVWEFVTACFTEQGCKDFLAIEGHNLKETRIYAAGSYRNHEFRVVRDWLKSIDLPTPETVIFTLEDKTKLHSRLTQQPGKPDLQHEYHATQGLWATDRLDLIPKNLAHVFFRIGFPDEQLPGAVVAPPDQPNQPSEPCPVCGLADCNGECMGD